MGHAADIVKHYADKNLPWLEFRAAIARHVRLLSVHDPDLARVLEETPLAAYRAKDKPMAKHVPVCLKVDPRERLP